MNTSWIDIKQQDGETFSGYLALPPQGSGPGIILLQEIWGVNDHIQKVAEQYAMDGFVVFAPDVYWRFGPRIGLNYDEQGNAAAYDYMNRLDKDQAVADIILATDKLKSLPEVTGKIGVIGYCMGGMLSYRTAAATHVDAAVCYYGVGIAAQLDQAKNIHAPVMFHHGLKDGLVPADAREVIRQTFAEHKDAVFCEYDADHGFNCWGRPAVYDQSAAATAQGKTLEFLEQYLSE